MDCTREICQLTSIKLQKFTKYQNPTDKHARRLKDIVEHIEQHVIDIYDFVLKHRYIWHFHGACSYALPSWDLSASLHWALKYQHIREWQLVVVFYT